MRYKKIDIIILKVLFILCTSWELVHFLQPVNGSDELAKDRFMDGQVLQPVTTSSDK